MLKWKFAKYIHWRLIEILWNAARKVWNKHQPNLQSKCCWAVTMHELSMNPKHWVGISLGEFHIQIDHLLLIFFMWNGYVLKWGCICKHRKWHWWSATVAAVNIDEWWCLLIILYPTKTTWWWNSKVTMTPAPGYYWDNGYPELCWRDDELYW